MKRTEYDTVVIGGSYAGLAAALQLARARRTVLVLDAGVRRNRFAGHSHGFLGQDGQPPELIQSKGKSEVLHYPSVTWWDGLATSAVKLSDGFAVRTASEEFHAKRLILATGVTDELPPVPGLAEGWGKRVFFCPYCDGYEFQLGRLGVLATGPQSAHFALLVSEWGAPGATTLLLNGGPEPDPAVRPSLAARGISLEPDLLDHVDGGQASLAVHFRDGRVTVLDGVFLTPRVRPNGAFLTELGCEMESGPMGPYLKTDSSKETTVRGVFACGDLATPLPGVAYAVADGVRAGAFCHQSLVFRPD